MAISSADICSSATCAAGVAVDQPADLGRRSARRRPAWPGSAPAASGMLALRLVPPLGQVGPGRTRRAAARPAAAARPRPRVRPAAGPGRPPPAAAAGTGRTAPAAAPSPATTLTAVSRPPPVACSAQTSPHSAHRVSPNDAFSTLQPVTTRPSAAWPAAPTRSREYGAYPRPAAAVAAARSAGQSMSIRSSVTERNSAVSRWRGGPVFPGLVPVFPQSAQRITTRRDLDSVAAVFAQPAALLPRRQPG